MLPKVDSMFRKLWRLIMVSLLSYRSINYTKNCPEICGDEDEPNPNVFDEIINGLTKCEEKKPFQVSNNR